jgi:hypothetical protein
LTWGVRCCIFCFDSQIAAEVETLVKKLTDMILAFRDIAINDKLAVYP